MRERNWIGLVLIAAGAVLTVAFIGVGPPLIILGILLLLSGWERISRSRSRPILLGSIAGLITLYLLLPLECAAPVFRGSSAGPTLSCQTVLGLPSPGTLWAVMAGCAAGIFVGIRVALSWRDGSSVP